MKKMIENKHMWHCCHGNGLFLGLLLLALGVWFLAKDLGWVSLNISIWPVILIILGLWIILKRRHW